MFDLSQLKLSDVFSAIGNVSQRAESPFTVTTPDDQQDDPSTQSDGGQGIFGTFTDSGEGDDDEAAVTSALEDAEAFSPGFAFPVPGFQAAIQDDFGEPREYRGGTHQGTDIVAPEGTPIVAPVAGEIVSIHSSVNGGNIIHMQGQDGRLYKFMHLSAYNADVGESVVSGQTIAFVGNTGHSSTPHLHFEVHEGGVPVDPHELLVAAAGDVADPTEVAEAKVGRFENESQTAFTAIEEWVKREAWKGEFSGFTEAIGMFVDGWGSRFYSENGRWPTPDELLSDPGFYEASLLHPFSVKFTGPAVGVVNAPEGRFFYTNDPVLGMRFNPVDGPRMGIDITTQGVDPGQSEFIPAAGQENASVLGSNLGGGAASPSGDGGGASPSPAPSPSPSPEPEDLTAQGLRGGLI